MLQDELREIRTQLRMAMNGVISTSMREKGMIYKPVSYTHLTLPTN